jgi:predicted enzyme related to lactoylglutathione lyase
MTTRDHAPAGAPCWVDLWTSDVEGSRRFYPDLFGWEALAPSPEFGGYFMFARDGVPVAGGMGPMPDTPADDRWRVYLASDDITKTVELAEREGANLISPIMDVADLGRQAVLLDPSGAKVGTWQPGTFPGFTVLGEHGAPSWFELHTRDHGPTVAFYRTVFGWETQVEGDTDEFRYTTVRDPEGAGLVAGVMDATPFLPAGEPPSWYVYWEVDDVEASAARAVELGGTVVSGCEATPYGDLAQLADPAGARFNLRRSPR